MWLESRYLEDFILRQLAASNNILGVVIRCFKISSLVFSQSEHFFRRSLGAIVTMIAVGPLRVERQLVINVGENRH